MTLAPTFLKRMRSPAAFAFILSLAFHLYLILRSPNKRSEAILPARHPIKMDVRVVTKEKKVSRNLSSTVESTKDRKEAILRKTSPANTTAASRENESPSQQGENPKTLPYKDLLPGSQSFNQDRSEGSDSGTQGVAGTWIHRPYTGNKASEIKAENSLIGAQFDLPLEFRRSISEGRAFVRIKQENDELIMEHLAGKAEIRAALFESLRKESNWEKIRKILLHFDSPSFQISVEFSTENIAASPREFETFYEVYDKEILIRIIHYPSYAASGLDPNAATTLDNEDARKARKRDKIQYSKLLDSPAYKHSLRNFSLKAPQ